MAFSQTLFMQGHESLHDYNLALGQLIHISQKKQKNQASDRLLKHYQSNIRKKWKENKSLHSS